MAFGQSLNPWDDPLAFLRLQQAADPFAGGVNGPGAQQPERQRGLVGLLASGLIPGSADMSSQGQRALINQGLLAAGLGILANNNQGRGGGTAIGSGLTQGLLAMNKGADQLADNRYRQQVIQRQLGDPAGFREMDLAARAAGYEPGTQGYKDYFRRANGELARQSSAAIGYKEFTLPNGQKALVALDPREIGAQVIGGGPAYGSFAGQGGYPAPPGQAPSQEQVDAQMAEIGRKATEYGYSLKAQGADDATVRFLQEAYFKDLAAQYANGAPGTVIEDGAGNTIGAPVDRSPATFAPGAAAPQPGAAAGQNPFLGPSAAAEARAVRDAQNASDAAFRPGQLAAETEAAIERAGGTATATAQANQAVKDTAAQAERNAVFKLYEAGVTGLRSGLEGALTFPGMELFPALSADQQIAQGGVAAMAPILKQLFRVAGEGTFTDRDQDMLIKMLPTRNDLPAARDAKLSNIDTIVRAKMGMPPAAAPAGASGSPVRIQSAEDYNALPSGAEFVSPDGKLRRKR